MLSETADLSNFSCGIRACVYAFVCNRLAINTFIDKYWLWEEYR